MAGGKVSGPHWTLRQPCEFRNALRQLLAKLLGGQHAAELPQRSLRRLVMRQRSSLGGSFGFLLVPLVLLLRHQPGNAAQLAFHEVDQLCHTDVTRSVFVQVRKHRLELLALIRRHLALGVQLSRDSEERPQDRIRFRSGDGLLAADGAVTIGVHLVEYDPQKALEQGSHVQRRQHLAIAIAGTPLQDPHAVEVIVQHHRSSAAAVVVEGNSPWLSIAPCGVRGDRRWIPVAGVERLANRLLVLVHELIPLPEERLELGRRPPCLLRHRDLCIDLPDLGGQHRLRSLLALDLLGERSALLGCAGKLHLDAIAPPVVHAAHRVRRIIEQNRLPCAPFVVPKLDAPRIRLPWRRVERHRAFEPLRTVLVPHVHAVPDAEFWARPHLVERCVVVQEELAVSDSVREVRKRERHAPGAAPGLGVVPSGRSEPVEIIVRDGAGLVGGFGPADQVVYLVRRQCP